MVIRDVQNAIGDFTDELLPSSGKSLKVQFFYEILSKRSTEIIIQELRLKKNRFKAVTNNKDSNSLQEAMTCTSHFLLTKQCDVGHGSPNHVASWGKYLLCKV